MPRLAFYFAIERPNLINSCKKDINSIINLQLKVLTTQRPREQTQNSSAAFSASSIYRGIRESDPCSSTASTAANPNIHAWAELCISSTAYPAASRLWASIAAARI
jgi:hypothetical protein